MTMPWDATSVECVDFDDQGLFRLKSIETDAGCNVVQFWMVHMELPSTDCDEAMDINCPGIARMSNALLTRY